MEEIYTTLANIAHNVLGTDPERIGPDTLIMEELGADSLDIVEMLAMIEDIYGIYIPDEIITGMRRVSDAAEYICINLKK